ncbi:aldo/keto reductase family oxidoreductase [Myxococcus sp. CA051A]|uniref:aldo/keto reductase family oxidoreductase n=1 Tax=unclassified Myxococcus TaxID=2648731 RepID=UPI00157B1E85|nr:MULTISPECIES: aldo/keto reductase family oxidoreductase [unclassified Myxococcus]NTX17335.1 aldo/keto reductase family oxidoreductase [Myxococcus sp. CA056]NTX40275.1 aldo/keto reductase family oxidoreductase [Myxococcus sp. CA033]NTX52214.1 aldo/keto reductase family oxidoreductase [Myxococcus sp. CA039A]NTX66754.1 aldo/keto reductase family oxidoreductase [Myxococcus sp. CA051A]
MTNTDRLGGRFTFPGTSLTVHRMGYGAMQLAGPHVWGPPSHPEAAAAVLREAIALGIDHIDTSDAYGPHVTNQLIHATLHPYPKNVVLVSKVGGRRGADRSWLPALSPAELRSGLQDNLRNLGLDAIDVVNLRMMSMTPTEGPLDKELAVLIELKREGLVRHIGLSNVTARQVEQAQALTEIVCVQNHYNLAHRGDDALIDALAKQGIAYVPFFPLGGFTPLQSSTLSEVSNELGATPMQVALAWLLHRAPNILLIPGTSSVAHLRENVAAASLVLPEKSITALDGIAR